MFTMTEISNPKLNQENINNIRAKFERNIATPEDYATLDYFISSLLGIKSYILSKLIKSGILSYEQYIIEREKPSIEKEHLINIDLYGIVMGAITYLDDYLKK